MFSAYPSKNGQKRGLFSRTTLSESTLRGHVCGCRRCVRPKRGDFAKEGAVGDSEEARGAGAVVPCRGKGCEGDGSIGLVEGLFGAGAGIDGGLDCGR